MKIYSNKTKKAFSLIELSIVLIIIGLLIAGITGGASLIKSAELRSVMGEARAYNVSVNNFYVQFDALPGDYNTALGTGGLSGDGNGRIEFINSHATAPVAEGLSAWHQLVAASIVESDFTPLTGVVGGTPASATGTLPQIDAGVDIASSKVKGGGWLFDVVTVGSETQSAIILTSSVAALTDVNINTVRPVTSVAVITPADALSIDTKLDDGDADSGAVTGLNGVTDIGGATAATCFSGSNYTTTDSDIECTLAFQIDVLS